MNNELLRLYDEARKVYPDRVFVPGEGDVRARVVLIGEAPGENEETQRRPFVGKAGENLNDFLCLSGIRRDELFITNAVKIRPVKTGKSGRNINRPPTRTEIDAFRPYLLKELAIIKPLVAVTLGNVPLLALGGKSIKIGSVHGSFIQTEGLLIYPMYHPASVIYNRSLASVYAEDTRLLGEWIKQNA